MRNTDLALIAIVLVAVATYIKVILKAAAVVMAGVLFIGILSLGQMLDGSPLMINGSSAGNSVTSSVV